MKILHLHLKAQYFDEIKSGAKKLEYRLCEKWEKRLKGKSFDEIHLYRGYPKKSDESKKLVRIYIGYFRNKIIHPYFGILPVKLVAIPVWVKKKGGAI